MFNDKAGKSYWDNTEANQRLAEFAFNGHASGLKNFAKRKLHSLFVDAFANIPAGSQLLEIGCGGSRFLPYFANEFGFKISGIDYSENGCKLAQEICQRNNAQVNIVCSDFFEAPSSMNETFDVLV